MTYFLLIISHFFLGWESSYASNKVRENLHARYETIFVSRAIFDEDQIVQLEEDTRNYFYEHYLIDGGAATDDSDALNGLDEEDADLYRLHNKLLIYLNFYQINIKGKKLDDWNPYRLLLESIRDVDHRYVYPSNQATKNYYSILQDATNRHLGQAIRNYQGHFPFLNWEFCTYFEASCSTEEKEVKWETAGDVALALNTDIDRLNAKVATINELTKLTFFGQGKSKYRRAVRDYLHTYEELIATPYGTLLFLISNKQHSKMLTPLSIFSSFRLPVLPHVDADTVLELFAYIEEMFTTRLAKLVSLRNGNAKQNLVDFLFRYHSLMLAEYLVNNPNFFNTINFYLNRSDVGRTANKKPAKHSGKLTLAGILGMSYAAVHHLGRFNRGKVFYFIALVIGGGSVAFSAVQQKSLTTVFSLHDQVAKMRDSIVMRQTNNLKYFLHQLQDFSRVRGDAIFQGGMLALYSILFLHHIHGAINVAKNSSYLKVFRESGEEIADRLSHLNAEYQDFNLQEISNTLRKYPNLSTIHSLSLSEKMEIISKLFGDYVPFKNWKDGVTELDDMTNEQAHNLRNIGKKLRQEFEPEEGVEELASRIGEPAELVTRELEKIRRLIKKLFDVDPHKGDHQVL